MQTVSKLCRPLQRTGRRLTTYCQLSKTLSQRDRGVARAHTTTDLSESQRVITRRDSDKSVGKSRSVGKRSTWNPGSRVQPLRVRASREAMARRQNQAVPRVTSVVCGEPLSRMNVTVTVVSGA
jgi:hypothetical protein